jgi:hypothetical protein
MSKPFHLSNQEKWKNENYNNNMPVYKKEYGYKCRPKYLFLLFLVKTFLK